MERLSKFRNIKQRPIKSTCFAMLTFVSCCDGTPYDNNWRSYRQDLVIRIPVKFEDKEKRYFKQGFYYGYNKFTLMSSTTKSLINSLLGGSNTNLTHWRYNYPSRRMHYGYSSTEERNKHFKYLLKKFHVRNSVYINHIINGTPYQCACINCSINPDPSCYRDIYC